MKYTIDWCENKMTAMGKAKLDCNLKDENGTLVQGVSIWAEFPGFSELRNGDSVEGELVPSKNPKYGPSLYAPRKPLDPPKFARQAKGANIEKMMEKKSEYIEKAQDRKNESIAFFNATNSAIALLRSDARFDETELKETIIEWRNWFLDEWRKYEAGDTTDKHLPFSN